MKIKNRSIVLIIHFLLYHGVFFADPLTIMTAPIGKKGYGHYQVTTNLLQGLEQLNVSYVYNPSDSTQVTDTVVVLANPQALSQVISLKKQKKIKKIIAGPNIMVKADEYGGLLASAEVDICIVPSQWVKKAYEEQMPALKGRIKCWYAGIDTTYWAPASQTRVEKQKNVLVYWKTESMRFITAIEALLKSYGFMTHRVQYGSYKPAEYKQLLQICDFAVFISRSESQGIALAEAWSMNIPTFVWNPEALHAHNYLYSCVSACPYLTEDTGFTWKSLQDLDERLRLDTQRAYSPRAWVQQHMTNRISAQLLLSIIDE